MRASSLAAAALLSLIVFTPALSAQFIQPTPEELKMTEDPKAPGAAAVYLNMSEDDNDPMHYQAIYARIKVLTEKGKDLGTVELPYINRTYKITDIKARTIHADGTVIPLEGRPEDLLAIKKGELSVSRKVFTLPQVEVGSILEYRYEIRYDDNMYSSPEWNLQQKYFVHKAHYAFMPVQSFQPGPKSMVSSSSYLVDHKERPINNLVWWMNLPKGAQLKSDVGGHYALDLEDIAAIPDEEWMPPTRSFLYRLYFYYQYTSDTAKFWMDEAKDWAKETDKFAEPSNGLKAAVAGIVAPADSDADKAKKLYAAVQALDNTDYSRKKSESELKALKLKDAKHAEDVWKQKSGDSEGIVLLYLAMLRAAGLKAYAVKVVNRDEAVFDPTYMYMGQLDDTLVDVQLGAQRFLTDPGQKMCPYQSTSWKHAGVRGLAESDQGPSLLTTPESSYKKSTLIRNGALTLDAHGQIVSGSLQFTLSGQEALSWRQYALRHDVDDLKKSFDRDLEQQVPQGVEAHVDHFLGLDTPETNLIAAIKVEGRVGTATGKRLLLPGFFFASRGNHPFVEQAKRNWPVDMHYARTEGDQIVYHLPEGFTVEGGLQDNNIPWTGHAVYVVKTVQQPGTVIVARNLGRAFSQAKPEEYEELRGFYQKVAASDQQQLVLAAPAHTEGN